jgi:hypothetical protein
MPFRQEIESKIKLTVSNFSFFITIYDAFIYGVPLATEPGISLIILPLLLRVATIRRTTDTFLFISHTTNVLLFSIFIGVRIIKEIPGSVASGTHCICRFKQLKLSNHADSDTCSTIFFYHNERY